MAVRILRGQPGIPSVDWASRRTRSWAGNPGFSPISFRLQTPNSPFFGRQLLKVSSHVREYSRFWETSGGDLIRSALRGPAYSAIDRSLEPFVPEIGSADQALRGDGGIRFCALIRFRLKAYQLAESDGSEWLSRRQRFAVWR
jgi:hypothetical protein